MPPDEPNAEERLEELPQDNGTPFRPADDQQNDNVGTVPDPVLDDMITNTAPLAFTTPPDDNPDDIIPPEVEQVLEPSKLDDTHPITDTNIQPEELYDEGISGAAEATEPNAKDTVIGYQPPDDPRNPS